MTDVIVVGGGSAGCAMAARLAEDPQLQVLLLEAGDTDEVLASRVPALVATIVQNPEFDWKYTVEPDASIGGRADVWPAGKRLGGGSSINGMMYVRGHAWDYDEWARRGAIGWSASDVLPYFKRLEDNTRSPNSANDSAWRGRGGPQSVADTRAAYAVTQQWIDAAVQAGIPRSPDLNGALAEGVDHVQTSQRSGMRHSSAAAYLRQGPRPSNLRVELKAQALGLILEGRRAVGVRYQQNGSVHEVRAGGGVVIAAGTLNTPRLLLLSGIGPGAQLQAHGIPVLHDLPGVGENLQDHVGTHLVNEVTVPTLNSAVQGAGGLWQLLRFLFTRRGALTTAIGHAQAFVRTREALSAPNIQLIFAPFAFDLDAAGKLQMRQRPAISTAAFVARPKARGSVALRSADPLAAPLIRHQLLEHDDDLAQLVEGIQFARRIVEQSALHSSVLNEVRPGAELQGAALAGFCRMAAIPGYHPVGTCRMGTDALAVTDADLRVHGIDGLWVADGSVMPTLPAGNTNATCLMIGDKGAEHVRRTLTGKH